MMDLIPLKSKRPKNIVQLLSCRSYTMNQSLHYSFQRFAEQKAAEDTVIVTNCDIPRSSRSAFLVSFSPDCTKVASTHGDHNIYVSDVNTAKNVKKLVGHPRTPWCISFHPMLNNLLASGCLGGEVRLWDLKGENKVWRTPSRHVIASLSFHPSLQLLIFASASYLYFWDWNQNVPAAYCSTTSHLEKVRFVRFDHYGHNIITGITNAGVSASSRLPAIESSSSSSPLPGERAAKKPRLQLSPDDSESCIVLSSAEPESESSSDSDKSVEKPAAIFYTPIAIISMLRRCLIICTVYRKKFTSSLGDDELKYTTHFDPSCAKLHQRELDPVEQTLVSLKNLIDTLSLSSNDIGSLHVRLKLAVLRTEEALERLNILEIVRPSEVITEMCGWFSVQHSRLKIAYSSLFPPLTPESVVENSTGNSVTSTCASRTSTQFYLESFSHQTASNLHPQPVQPLMRWDAGKIDGRAQRSLRVPKDVTGIDFENKSACTNKGGQKNSPSKPGTSGLGEECPLSTGAIPKKKRNLKMCAAKRNLFLDSKNEPKSVHSKPSTSNEPDLPNKSFQSAIEHNSNENFANSANFLDNASTSSNMPSFCDSNKKCSSSSCASKLHCECSVPVFESSEKDDICDNSRNPSNMHQTSENSSHSLVQNVTSADDSSVKLEVTSHAKQVTSVKIENQPIINCDKLPISVVVSDESSSGSSTDLNDSSSEPSPIRFRYTLPGYSSINYFTPRVFMLDSDEEARNEDSDSPDSDNSEDSFRTSMEWLSRFFSGRLTEQTLNNDGSLSVNLSENRGSTSLISFGGWRSCYSIIPGGRYNPVNSIADGNTHSHRIQLWDYSEYQFPEIQKATKNVVVKRCMIHNDATVDISQDGEKLIALIPHDYSNFENLRFGIYSLRQQDLGTCLHVFGSIYNAISVSFSPLAEYVIAASSFRPPYVARALKNKVIQVFKVGEKRPVNESIKSCSSGNIFSDSLDSSSLNCVRWMPQSGLGIICTNNVGEVTLCKPQGINELKFCQDHLLVPKAPAKPSASD